jgi:hypothetical protein
MEAEMARKEEEERLINLLREEEEAERMRAAAAAKRAREEAMKAEMMAANEQMLALKAQRQAEERAEEERFRQMLLAKFAEDERIEQMNAQRRRMKEAEHRREVRCPTSPIHSAPVVHLFATPTDSHQFSLIFWYFFHLLILLIAHPFLILCIYFPIQLFTHSISFHILHSSVGALAQSFIHSCVHPFLPIVYFI